MELSIDTTVTLANGVEMPVLGFGTFKIRGDEAYTSVREALDVGYRSIDTASLYGNEAEVGRALRDSGIARGEVFIATKCWNDEQGEQGVLTALERSLGRLGLDYVDLYLVHWPISRLYASTWRGMERAFESGKARAIGVCNFLGSHLDGLAQVAEIAPMVDQVEHHPYLQQPALRDRLRRDGIALEAWAPIARGRLLDDPVLLDIAARHSVTPAQVAIRWVLQNGGIAIPKSVTPSRIRENADVFSFALSDTEKAAIDVLDRGEDGRSGTHPDEFARS
ncbi:MAG: aldo/keto reductase [Clostridiales bacterium]|nr:aldo/keto reductase [Clostridiales bacterium]